MVRPKKPISPTKEDEIRQKLLDLVPIFKKDLKGLELAKREYSDEFVKHVANELGNILPQQVLNMRMTDFIKHMEQDMMSMEEEDEEMNGQQENSQMAASSARTPNIPHPSYYKNLKMTDGLHVKIPSCITPRVQGNKMHKPRPSRYGEILFSVRGTPVLNSVTAANVMDAKKQDAIVQSLMHQEDTLMTPETRKIIGKLKALVQKKGTETEEDSE